ncbi:MAG: hypothetical protein PHS44_06600, partial [Candidatus Dojkabacteria bacterium]|nr:hypothetical protein [Candidatus Dojkabacteria bacterium]
MERFGQVDFGHSFGVEARATVHKGMFWVDCVGAGHDNYMTALARINYQDGWRAVADQMRSTA